jgi:hypothetical protein
VLLDADLAQLYEVATRVFNQTVNPNSRRRKGLSFAG